jgi:protoheme ferro-lyase
MVGNNRPIKKYIYYNPVFLQQEIIVLIEIKEHYQVSLENRKSLIIIEMINAAEEFSLSLMIIIQRQDLMIS